MLLVAGCSAAAPTIEASGTPRPSGLPSAPTPVSSPRATGRLGPAGTPAPDATLTPRPSGPSRLVEHGDRASGKVALTFTVGYRLDPAIEILGLLRSRGVSATIFMSGIVFDQVGTRAAAEAGAR